MNSLTSAVSLRFPAQACIAAACWSGRVFLLAFLFSVLSTESRAQIDFVWVGQPGNENFQFNDKNNWRADGPNFDPPPHPGSNAAIGSLPATTIVGSAACDLLLLGGSDGNVLTMAGAINVLSLNAQTHVVFEQNVAAPEGVGATGTVTFNGTVTGGAVGVVSVDGGGGVSFTTTTFNNAVTTTDHSRPSFLVATQGAAEPGVAYFAPGSSLDSGPMSIGYFSAGTLTLAPGVMAKATSGDSTIAAVTIGALSPSASGFGLASLDGGAVLEAVGDTHIGVASTGILVATGGAQVQTSGQAVVGMSPSGNGSVTLQDTGSKWKVDGTLIIGQAGDMNNVATGQVSVRSGAMLEVNAPQVILGQESNSIGGLTLDGFTSKLTGLGSTNVEIGRHGTGTLELLNGAQFSVESLILGALNGGNGKVKVDGNQSGTASTFDVRGSLTIGGVSDASGEIDITGGGQVVSRGNAIIGRDAGSVGLVMLSGLGSIWNLMPGAVLGDVTVGKAGTGTLKIADQAMMSVNQCIVAESTNSSGEIMVDGGNSTLHVSDLRLGHNFSSEGAGDGQLKILNGGNVTVDSIFFVGDNVGTGSIIVSGISSGGSPATLSTKHLILSHPSTGLPALSIAPGGQVFVTGPGLNDTFSIGPGSGSIPTLQVDGAGSQLTVSNRKTVVNGAASISGGGAATMRFLDIASSNGQAKMSVGGDPSTTSTLTLTGDLNVGLASDDVGTLDIGAGGQADLPNSLVVSVRSGQISVHDSGARLTLGFVDFRMFGGGLNISAGGAVSTSPLSTVDVRNAGTILVSNAGSQFSTGDIYLRQNCSLTTSDNSHVAIALFLEVNGGGTVSATAGGSIDIGPVVVNPAGNGSIAVQPFGSLTVDGSVTGNVVNVLNLGKITGSGTINGQLINSGTVAPGNSQGALTDQGNYRQNSVGTVALGNLTGTLTVQGDYTQNSDGLMRIEIGGTDAGTSYDQLQVNGAAAIAGNLDVWLVNGFTPAVGQTFRIVSANSFSGGFASIAGPSQAGISVSNDATGVTVTITSVVAGAPVISSPTTVSGAQGETFSYQIAATNNPTSFGAMNLPDGLTVDHSSGLISGTPAQAGNYVVPIAANNAAGSGQAVLTIEVGGPVIQQSQFLNISTRMRVQTEDNVLIGGFIITGTDPKRMIIRGIGPSLSSFFGGVLADPTLELFQGGTLLAMNDNWKTDQRAEIEATGVPPTNDFESAIVRTLAPGSYTAILRGNGNTTGIAVVEAYDLDQAANSRLANISTRGFVETGDNVMIGGLIIGPPNGTSATAVVRAIGPTLGVFGIPGALQDPTLDLVDSNGVVIRSNNDWMESQANEIIATGLQPTDDRESALVETLVPGNYTAIVRGFGNTTGVGLVEAYHLQ